MLEFFQSRCDQRLKEVQVALLKRIVRRQRTNVVQVCVNVLQGIVVRLEIGFVAG